MGIKEMDDNCRKVRRKKGLKGGRLQPQESGKGQ